MKYIRTADGRIIKIGEQFDIGYEKGTFEVHNKVGIVASYEPIDVLKIADTIKKLCDGYVVDNGDDWCSFKDFGFAKQDCNIRKRYGENNVMIYGVIKTDKGLIYVAKMNEKGELELL